MGKAFRFGRQACHFYLEKGYCRYGDSCRFTHDVTQEAAAFSELDVNKDVTLKDRQWHNAQGVRGFEQVRDSVCSFRMMSYNILADELAHKHKQELYPFTDVSDLHWPKRMQLIINEVDLWTPDVICFQEVDHYDELQEILACKGYSGHYAQRGGGRNDGCATFWRTSKFSAYATHTINFNALDLKDNVALMVVLSPHSCQQPTPQPNTASPPRALFRGSNPVRTPPGRQQSGSSIDTSPTKVLKRPRDGGNQKASDSAFDEQTENPSKQHCSSDDSMGEGEEIRRSRSSQQIRLRAAGTAQQEDENAEIGTASHPIELDFKYAAAPRTDGSTMAMDTGVGGWNEAGRRDEARGQGATFSEIMDLTGEPDEGVGQDSTHSDRQQGKRPLLLVGNIHVLFNPRRGDIKLAQLRVLTSRMKEMAASLSGPDTEVLSMVGGDFNSVPDSGLYRFMRDGTLNLGMEDRKTMSGLHPGRSGFTPPKPAPGSSPYSSVYQSTPQPYTSPSYNTPFFSPTISPPPPQPPPYPPPTCPPPTCPPPNYPPPTCPPPTHPPPTYPPPTYHPTAPPNPSPPSHSPYSAHPGINHQAATTAGQQGFQGPWSTSPPLPADALPRSHPTDVSAENTPAASAADAPRGSGSGADASSPSPAGAGFSTPDLGVRWWRKAQMVGSAIFNIKSGMFVGTSQSRSNPPAATPPNTDLQTATPEQPVWHTIDSINPSTTHRTNDPASSAPTLMATEEEPYSPTQHAQQTQQIQPPFVWEPAQPESQPQQPVRGSSVVAEEWVSREHVESKTWLPGTMGPTAVTMSSSWRSTSNVKYLLSPPPGPYVPSKMKQVEVWLDNGLINIPTAEFYAARVRDLWHLNWTVTDLTVALGLTSLQDTCQASHTRNTYQNPGLAGRQRGGGNTELSSMRGVAAEVAMVGQPVAHHELQLLSAYSACTGSEPSFTTCHHQAVETVDFVWFTPGTEQLRLRPCRVLLPPSCEEWQVGMPNQHWPSDHVSLLVDFAVSPLQHRRWWPAVDG